MIRKLVVGALVLAGAGAGVWYFMQQAGGASKAATAQSAASSPGAYVSVETARREEVVETVTVTGSLTARREVLAGPEIDGLRIIEILAEEGDRVKQGQVLVRLSRETLDALVAQSDAALLRADAAIAQTQSQILQAESNATWTSVDLKRARDLLARGASTQAIVDQKTNAARSAQAQLEALRNGLAATQAEKKNIEAQRRELMIRVARTEVRAPAGGMISRRSAKLGALAAAASPEPLFRIIEDGEIELDAEVPEQRLLQLREGQSARVLLADGSSINGRVRLISPEINATTRLGRVRIALDPDPRVRTGSFARGVIELRRTMAVTIPSSALIYDSGKTRVQTVAANAVRVKPVETGLVSGARAEILSGLKEGETIIVRAGPFLREGDAVTPVSEEKAR